MVHFVLFLQAAQDGNGGLHGGLAHQDFLEAALQRSVFFDVLAVFVQRGGAHAVQLAAREGWLEHIARVHRAFALARAHHGVQLVDEDDGLALVLGQLVQHGFQALFKFAPVLGASQQGRHVQAEDALALERFRHFARHDALGQAFHNRRFAHAGLADQHGVVLAAALQHLDGAADFIIAANHGVELAGAGALGQVQAILLQRAALAFGLGAVHLLAAAHGVDGGFQALAGQAVVLGDLGGVALAIGQRQQEEFAGNELVAALDGFLFSGLQHAAQLGAALHLVVPLHLRQALDGSFGRAGQARHVGARALQQRFGAIVLLEHGQQHVHGFDVGVVVGQGQALGIAQGFLELGGEFVETHGSISSELQSIWGMHCLISRQLLTEGIDVRQQTKMQQAA